MDIIKFPDNVELRIYPGGTKHWYKGHELHRDDDLPAIERDDGSKFWYKNGKIHRDNDLPALMRPNGLHNWYVDGQPVPPPSWYKILEE